MNNSSKHTGVKAMSYQHSSNSANQSVPSIVTIDTLPIIEHGESPTAIILSIAILSSTLIGSITGLVRVILMAKPRR
ncbi:MULTISPECIES: hypothetical protein [unclassified Microcoleus]|uniref:hypothetical protein n=1 Tax=unclassified Microcoleus TaxID=2642155 RepID=UPI001E01BFFC|nr:MULTISPECIES: hypothetical protein [unclassified Microcoleus]TAE70024.1 MAG: hypothetical protein EAZ86_08540 [Oscillatoriales cyanobacterium]MCC3416069.1 hypothetical protein [Microcoleus sp. PH2017_02_FOX_O_A]MCC3437031.1 hypothetical protein [Microcoleus sp. PH2017_05_CCC_O_A]MCC3473503.1 hypothetical protein [Microcoleus sp. PH2017_13_LAR_U_A]MCC3485892.1 hypothetical protein [Microcoleus sp. PH2017_14_LAR_D_A]